MPSRMYEFVCYWRSRGWTRRQAWNLWRMYQIPRHHVTPGDVRWALEAT